jgi:hypothetical protein
MLAGLKVRAVGTKHSLAAAQRWIDDRRYHASRTDGGMI